MHAGLETSEALVASWLDSEGTVNTNDEILHWIEKENQSVVATLRPTALSDSNYWYLDRHDRAIVNQNRSFFAIAGIKGNLSDGQIIEQPIIRQHEIGYLGIICKEIDGRLNLLMQAKIEPGNVNKVQVSPTIQATKSNYTQRHGGRKPQYLEEFQQAADYEVVYDSLQSEQCSRFLGKYNRNVLIRTHGEVDVAPHFMWMTIGQVKHLMKTHHNLVNMDARSVLSGISYWPIPGDPCSFSDEPIGRSICGVDDSRRLLQLLDITRSRGTRQRSVIPVDTIPNWRFADDGIACLGPAPFRVGYFDIEIEGREVRHWNQPMFIAIGEAFFGLLAVEREGEYFFLIKCKEEIGAECYVSFGPTVQREGVDGTENLDEVEELFSAMHRQNSGVLTDSVQSEEGGRFYHEQNRNVIIRADSKDLPPLPEGYHLANYRTICGLMSRAPGSVNIQLRNLIALLGA